VPPSPLSLLGLVRHRADVESGWFSRVEGRAMPARYPTEQDPDRGFRHATADPAQGADAFDDWQGQIEHAREVVARTDLDATCVHPRHPAADGDQEPRGVPGWPRPRPRSGARGVLGCP
jgi:Protein of unknown function (DUF664)